MSGYCIKCGKAIKEYSPGNGLFCGDCAVDGKKDILLLTDDPQIITAYRTAAGRAVPGNGKFSFTLSPEQQGLPAPPRNNDQNGAGTQLIQPPAPMNNQVVGYNHAFSQGPGYQAPYSHPAPKKKNKSKRIIIAVTVLVIAIAAAVLFRPILGTIKVIFADSTTTTMYSPKFELWSPTGQYTVTSSEEYIYMYWDDDGSGIIGMIPSGTVINVTETNNNYAKTTYKNCTGWVSIDDISYTPGAYDNYNGYSPGLYEVTNVPAVNIRSAPDTSDDNNIIGKVYPGERYELSTFDGEWARITLNDGQQGWVYMYYMEYVGAGSDE